MTREFIYTLEFDKEWQNLNLTNEDKRQLEIFLLKNITAGDIIEKTGGVRKLRWYGSGKAGKSSGIRVIYIDFEVKAKLVFITVYPKSKKDNLSDAEKKIIYKFVKILGKEIN